jgi:DNA-binding response OmpR family regulator
MDKVRILYIEDEPFLGKIVRESLESRKFEVRHLEDGRNAMPVCSEFDPHICLLDVMLPYEDGFTIGKKIRAHHPALPIIYLTAKDQTEDVLEGFSAGGNDYIRKPFSMEELIVRVQNLLQLKSAHTPPKTSDEGIPLGQFTFYPKRQELVLENKSRRISYRETQLLELLSKAINQAIERKEILDGIWGNDSFFNSRNLDVYITRLREYLREDDSLEIITLKGVGYRLVVK